MTNFSSNYLDDLENQKQDPDYKLVFLFLVAMMYIIWISKDYIIKKLLKQQKKPKIQRHRGFKKHPDNVKYRQGHVFSQPESDGTLSGTCIEYKAFFDCVNNSKQNVLNKFIFEVLPFACACLNKRQNGIIYFGVADSKQKKNEFENYKHGEIVGFRIDEIGLNCKHMYTDKLREGIKNFFHPSVASIAKNCISNPKFIVVEGTNLYVMEVEIEPHSIFCGSSFFKINPNSIENKTKAPKAPKKNDYKIFVRDGSSTKRLNNDHEINQFHEDLLKFVACRNSFDKKVTYKKLQSQILKKNKCTKKKYSTGADYIYFIYYFVHNCYLFLISVFSLKPPLCKDEQISLS